MNYEEIGKKMKEIRISKNLSQEEFAEEIGITPSYLGQVERGQRKISLPTLEKISAYFKASFYTFNSFLYKKRKTRTKIRRTRRNY